MKREADTEIMLPQTKKCLELSAVGGVKKQSLSYKFQKEHSPVGRCLGLRFLASRNVNNEFLLFQVLQAMLFITAALRNCHGKRLGFGKITTVRETKAHI